MCRPEILAKTINIVSKGTEVSADRILSSDKDMETADARYPLVFFPFESGMYPSRTAAHVHKSRRAADCMISDFHEGTESGGMTGIYWDDIRDLSGNG